MQQNVPFLKYLKKITRALLRKIQCLDVFGLLRAFRLELLVIDDLKKSGKIHQTGFRNIENIVIVKVPLDLQNSHHPGIWLFNNLQSHNPSGPASFDLSFKIFQEI